VQGLDEAIFGASAYTAAQWQSEFDASPGGIFLCADGFVSARLSGDDLEIVKVGVVPGKRRRGIAQGLLRHVAAALLPGSGRCLIEVSAANAGGVAFYAKLGFNEIARRTKYYADGNDAILMQGTIK